MAISVTVCDIISSQVTDKYLKMHGTAYHDIP